MPSGTVWLNVIKGNGNDLRVESISRSRPTKPGHHIHLRLELPESVFERSISIEVPEEAVVTNIEIIPTQDEEKE